MKLKKGTIYTFKVSGGVRYFMIISAPKDGVFKEMCLSSMTINYETVKAIKRDINDRHMSFLNTDKAK